MLEISRSRAVRTDNLLDLVLTGATGLATRAGKAFSNGEVVGLGTLKGACVRRIASLFAGETVNLGGTATMS